MSGGHMQVLAAQIYNDQNIVTYRLLSRLLGVHVNLAKQMLQEFYQQAKLDGKSCYATYILSGLIEESIPATGNEAMQMQADDFPMSSPIMATQESSRSNGSSTRLVRTIILANENEVYETRAKFTELTSIHVYSLSPAPVNDPILLTTCSYDISKNYDSTALPTELSEKYGVIANPNAVKRELKQHAAPTINIGTAAAKSKATAPPPKAVQKKPSPPPDTKPTAPAPQSATETTKPSGTGMKRTISGGIMSAFANAPPKGSKPKPKQEETETAPPVKRRSLSPKPEPKISAKKQREIDEINKMMEEDEPEELEDFPPEAPAMEESQDTSMAADSPATVDTATPAGTPPKRKRGKRKVLRKTTKRDEKGYLVTKNEYVYESFSEEEESDPAPKPMKRTSSTLSAGAGDKKKGKANAAGQKSLMSFFGKK